MELLSERISELEKDLVVREEEVGQLALQLELKNRESRATEEQLHVHIAHLQVRLWSPHICIMSVVWQSGCPECLQSWINWIYST